MEPAALTFAILAYDGIESIDIGATYGVLSMDSYVWGLDDAASPGG